MLSLSVVSFGFAEGGDVPDFGEERAELVELQCSVGGTVRDSGGAKIPHRLLSCRVVSCLFLGLDLGSWSWSWS